MPDKQYILVIGNPINGFRFVGPFGNPINGFRFVSPFATADDAAEPEQDIDDDWWIAELESPNDNP